MREYETLVANANGRSDVMESIHKRNMSLYRESAKKVDRLTIELKMWLAHHAAPDGKRYRELVENKNLRYININHV